MGSPITRRSRKRERTRSEILAAAARLLAAQEFQDLRIAAICAEADVARATFFLHFDHKSALLLAWEVQLVEALNAVLPEASGRARVATVYRAMTDVFWRDPAVARGVIGHVLADAAPGPLVDRVGRVLSALAGRGELRQASPPDLAARIWLGEIAAALGTAEGRRGSLALRDELLRIVLSGVAESKPRLKWSPRDAPGVPRSV